MKKLALINLSMDEKMFRPGKRTLTLSYLADLLSKNYRVLLLPDTGYHKNDFKELEKEVLHKIKDADIIGL